MSDCQKNLINVIEEQNDNLKELIKISTQTNLGIQELTNLMKKLVEK